MITKIEKFKESFEYSIPQVKPKTKDELIKIIRKIIEKSPKRNMCDLNFIDTSLITDMSYLFWNFDFFTGDISKWDVSNVTNMEGMFSDSIFNGDISQWDVSNVTNMAWMFSKSKFNQDISQWDVSNVTYMSYMFTNSQFNGDISKWDVSNVTHMQRMFDHSPLDSNSPHWYKNN